MYDVDIADRRVVSRRAALAPPRYRGPTDATRRITANYIFIRRLYHQVIVKIYY